jgi:hypothetical protein
LWAFFPTWIGVILWNFWHLLNYILGIKSLPILKKYKVFIFWFCLQELITSLLNVQTNPTITALMIGVFVFFEREQYFWAAGVLVFGLFFKIYVIVAGALFMFYPQKLKFIAYCIFWGIICFCLPLIFISWQELITQYLSWYKQLQLHSQRESLTFLGVLNKFSGQNISRIWTLIPAVLLTVGVYYRTDLYKNLSFKLTYLASLLIFAVIFNPGAESPTYVIAVTGVVLWYFSGEKTMFRWVLLWLVFVFTCLSPTDIFPPFLRKEFFEPYYIKAIPCIIVWFVSIYELYFSKFEE